MTIAVVSQFKQLRISLRKGCRVLNGVRTRCLCVRAAVLYRLSFEVPYMENRSEYTVVVITMYVVNVAINTFIQSY